MATLGTRLAAIAADTTDTIIALVEAAWPRSMTSREVDRLAQDGYRAGSVCELYYLLSFDMPDWEPVLGELQRAGFTVREGGSLGPFVTVKTPVRLRAFELSLASARLDRIVAPYGGFATVIGPAVSSRRDECASDTRHGRAAVA